MIAVCASVAFHLDHVIQNPSGRFIFPSTYFNNHPFVIVNLYAPKSLQSSFNKSLLCKLQPYPLDRIFICGDFSEVVDPSLDYSSSSRKRSTSLSSLLLKENIYNVWQCMHKSEKDHTYFSQCHLSCSRIYLFLATPILLQKASSSTIGLITWSAHAPITIGLTLSNPPKSLTTWRMNTSLLAHPSYG